MKKRWGQSIAALLTVVILLAALSELEFAMPPCNDGDLFDQGGSEDATPPNVEQPSLINLMYDAGVEGASVSLRETDGEYFLFLPSSADLSELALWFEGEPVTLTACEQSITVTSGQAFDLAALCSPADNGVSSVTLSREDVSVPIKIMVSANIGSMFITSADPVNKGRDYVEEVKGNKATGRMTLLGADGEPVYTGSLTQIKGRGNSTWGWYKKPYQIKLDKKTDLLETGDPGEAAKTWILLANYYDDAFIRNSLTFDLAAELGLPYSPGSRPLDLYYDGEYRGTYLLCEKTEIGKARVDIHDLEEDYEDANPDVDDFDGLPTAKDTNAYGNEFQYVTGLRDPANISGGYLLEMDFDWRAWEEKSFFTTSQDYFIVSKSPEYLSRNALEYVSGLWQEFEDAVWNGGVNPDTGKSYTDYVDLDSLVQCYLISELAQDGDTFRSSSFFYKPIDEEKLYAGPVWDFDAGYGKYSFFSSDTYLVFQSTSFGQKLMEIPSFYETVKNIYQNKLHPLVTDVLSGSDANVQNGRLRTLTAYQAEVAVSQQMNSVLWPECNTAGYVSAVNELRNFISRRDEYLNTLDWANLPSALMFADISAYDWFVPAVSYAVDKGLLAGTGDGLFSPEATMTRAMTVTVLHRLAGEPDAADSFAFDDVPSDQWYFKAVAWAAEAGIVSGYSGGLFRPDDEITRQEMAVIFYQYYTRYLGRDAAAPALPNRFSDRDSIAGWAMDAMSWAVDQGILNGVSETELSPDSYAQRCMAAAMLQRYCGVIDAEPAAE